MIDEYGADAVRFTLTAMAAMGRDLKLSTQRIAGYRNFTTKLWNACRFRQMQSSAGAPPAPGVQQAEGEGRREARSTHEVQGEIDPRLLTSDDKWILLKLDQAIREITAAFEEYKFNEATATLYRFFWSEYCDWYVEASKAALRPVDSLNSEMVKSATDSTVHKTNNLAVIDFELSGRRHHLLGAE